MSASLWRPAVTIQLSTHELMDLMDAHLLRARNAAVSEWAEVQRSHESRAADLRQRVESVAPHLLTPNGTAVA